MDYSSIKKRILKNWNDIEWWRYVAYPFAVRKLILQPYYQNLSDHTGVHIMDEEWDNLIILDGCRYDMFEEMYSGPGELTSIRSLGSATPEFLRKNFGRNEYHDTVYVTANPQVSVHLDDPFHDVISVWETSWDNELNTVHPEAISEATIKAHQRYPNKRIISHFIQPHYPFIGEYGRLQLGTQAGVELSKRMANDEHAESDDDHAWLQLSKGILREDELKKAYYENLQLALQYVNELVDCFDERTVVTSDHGNLYGQRGPLGFSVYGHPNGVYHEDLITVPWLVVGEESKRIISEPPKKREVSENINERLTHLGYK